jgi:hypothetical protein
MERHIYTLVRRTDWAAAEQAGAYTGSEDDRHDGFLHFSTAGQLRATAAKHRAGEADLVIVEGAGSAAEINLRANDIANMGFARAADVPVIVLGDIDRGGLALQQQILKAAELRRGEIQRFEKRGVAGIDLLAEFLGERALGLRAVDEREDFELRRAFLGGRFARGRSGGIGGILGVGLGAAVRGLGRPGAVLGEAGAFLRRPKPLPEIGAIRSGELRSLEPLQFRGLAPGEHTETERGQAEREREEKGERFHGTAWEHEAA